MILYCATLCYDTVCIYIYVHIYVYVLFSLLFRYIFYYVFFFFFFYQVLCYYVLHITTDRLYMVGYMSMYRYRYRCSIDIDIHLDLDINAGGYVGFLVLQVLFGAPGSSVLGNVGT